MSSGLSQLNSLVALTSRYARRVKPEVEASDIQPYDVICGRSKLAFNNVGNKRFRITISLYAATYVAANTRTAKTQVIMDVTALIHSNGGRFLKQIQANKFQELTLKQAREKVGHAIRDYLVTINKAKSKTNARPAPAANHQQNSSTASVLGINRPCKLASIDEVVPEPICKVSSSLRFCHTSTANVESDVSTDDMPPSSLSRFASQDNQHVSTHSDGVCARSSILLSLTSSPDHFDDDDNDDDDDDDDKEEEALAVDTFDLASPPAQSQSQCPEIPKGDGEAVSLQMFSRMDLIDIICSENWRGASTVTETDEIDTFQPLPLRPTFQSAASANDQETTVSDLDGPSIVRFVLQAWSDNEDSMKETSPTQFGPDWEPFDVDMHLVPC